MGLFDRMRKTPEGPGTASRGAASGGLTTKVPEGHRVDIFRPALEPRVSRTSGGVVVADLGFGSDELPEVRGELFREVERAMSSPHKAVCLAHHQGSIQGLFAPAEPQVVKVAAAVLWVLHAAGLGDWLDDPARLQELLRRLHRLARQEPPISQVVYLVDHSSAQASLVSDLVGGLGIAVRAPEEDGSVLAEVHRPEGVVISALTGAPLAAADTPVDPYPRAVNEEKDAAEVTGDRDRLRQIEERERTFLAKRTLAVIGDRRKEALARAPRLNRLLLEVATAGSSAAWEALNAELLRRDHPLVLMADPRTKGVAPRAWPGVGKAIPAYPDLVSLDWTARDLKMPSSSFGLALMPPRALFEWAAKIGVAVAINVYRDRSSPLYVMLPVDRVEALASSKPRPVPR